MQVDTDLTGLFGVTLVIVTLLVRVPHLRALPLLKRVGWLAAMVIVLSIPLWGVSPAGFVRGVAGDLSIATLVLLALALVRSLTGRALVEEQNRNAILRAILITGLLFYPLA